MDGRKDDNQKLRHDLIPPSALEEIVKVLNFGAAKYNDHNWTKVPNLEARYYAALQRHLVAWRKGEIIDAESGLPHLAHAGCCLIFLLSKQVGFDRPLTEPVIADDLGELDPDVPIPYSIPDPLPGGFRPGDVVQHIYNASGEGVVLGIDDGYIDVRWKHGVNLHIPSYLALVRRTDCEAV